METQWRDTLKGAHALAQETVLTEFQQAIEENPPLLEEEMKSLFQREWTEQASQEQIKSQRDNEAILKDCLEELSQTPRPSHVSENGIPLLRLAELLEVPWSWRLVPDLL
jgi:hypothetical protein